MSNVVDHKVMAMDVAKRERVINAAMEEFCKGYKYANTDVVVNKAGISKGLLYHYFKTKKELLSYVYQYASELIVQNFLKGIDFSETDFLKRLWQMITVKVQLSYQYPMVFEFIGAVYFSQEAEMVQVMEQFKTLAGQWWQTNSRVFEGLDLSLFKEGIDVEKAINVIRFSLTSYTEQQLKTNPKNHGFQPRFEELMEDLGGYMDLFRTAFYKQ